MESDQRVHTKFFETDRSLSSFTMMCQPDGSFQFENARSKWPTCLEGIQNNYCDRQHIYKFPFQILSVLLHLLQYPQILSMLIYPKTMEKLTLEVFSIHQGEGWI